MKVRSIFLCIVFSLFTFGLYFFYWFVSLTNASNKMAPKHATAGGIAALFLTVITAGLYRIYWCYMAGQKAGEMVESNGEGMFYILITLFTFSIVPQFLLQSAVNRALKSKDAQA